MELHPKLSHKDGSMFSTDSIRYQLESPLIKSIIHGHTLVAGQIQGDPHARLLEKIGRVQLLFKVYRAKSVSTLMKYINGYQWIYSADFEGCKGRCAVQTIDMV